MKDWILKHLVEVLFGGGGLAGSLLIRMFWPRLERMLVSIVTKWIMGRPSAADRVLAYAIVSWAEEKIKEAGAGKEKYRMADEALNTFAPSLSIETRKAYIEHGVTKLNQILEDVEKTKKVSVPDSSSTSSPGAGPASPPPAGQAPPSGS